MTAGILVCCMPTIAAVFRHWKSSTASFLSSRRLQSKTPFDLQQHAKLESDSDLQLLRQQNRHPKAGSGTNAFIEKADSTTSIWSHQEGAPFPGPSQDTSIFKTAHINVWNTSDLESQCSTLPEVEPELQTVWKSVRKRRRSRARPGSPRGWYWIVALFRYPEGKNTMAPYVLT